MKHLLILLLATLDALLSTAQPGYFNQRYATPTGGQSAITAIARTATGAVACGAEYPLGAISPIALQLSFLDEQGQVLHRRTYGRPGYKYYPAPGEGFFPLPDGGFALASANTLPTGKQVAALWRFTPAGDTLWMRQFDLDSATSCYGGCRTRDGGFVLIGTGVTFTTAGWNLVLIRTDSVGTMLWHKTYHWQRLNRGWSVAELADGSLLLGGVTSDLGFVRQSTLVIRTDSAGNRLWRERFGPPDLINGIGIVRPTHDGGWALLAAMGKTVVQIGTTIQTSFRHCVRKFDAQNQLLWTREIGPVTRSADAYALLELPDGSLVAVGQETGPVVPYTPPRGVLFKLCAAGDSVFYRTYQLLTGGNSHNYLRGLAATPDGGFVAAGFVFPYAPDTGSSDAWVLRVDSAGYLQAGGPPPPVVCPRPVGLAPLAAPEALAVDVYPNPAPDGRFSVRPQRPGARYEVRDALGRRLAEGPLPGSEPVVNLQSQPPGLYLLRLTWPDGRTLSRRLLR